jgi:hypothetical protein
VAAMLQQICGFEIQPKFWMQRMVYRLRFVTISKTGTAIRPAKSFPVGMIL